MKNGISLTPILILLVSIPATNYGANNYEKIVNETALQRAIATSDIEKLKSSITTETGDAVIIELLRQKRDYRFFVDTIKFFIGNKNTPSLLTILQHQPAEGYLERALYAGLVPTDHDVANAQDEKHKKLLTVFKIYYHKLETNKLDEVIQYMRDAKKSLDKFITTQLFARFLWANNKEAINAMRNALCGKGKPLDIEKSLEHCLRWGLLDTVDTLLSYNCLSTDLQQRCTDYKEGRYTLKQLGGDFCPCFGYKKYPKLNEEERGIFKSYAELDSYAPELVVKFKEKIEKYVIIAKVIKITRCE